MVKLYAIGFKNHVELRTAMKPPVAHVSQVTREMNVKVPKFVPPTDPHDFYGSYKTVVVKKKVPLTVVYHEGGKVITSMKTATFRHLTKLHVSNGTMLEVPKEAAKQFLENNKDVLKYGE